MTAPGTVIKSASDAPAAPPVEQNNLLRTDNVKVVESQPIPTSPVAPEDPQRIIRQGEPQPPLETGNAQPEPAPIPDAEESRAQRKARLATVLERGILGDRLKVDLPSDLHGEWVRNDPLEVNRLQALGFEIDYNYAPKRALHSDGTGAAIVGDVIHMICPRETKEIIDEIRHDQFMAANNPKKAREERELENEMHAQTGGILPTVTESKTRQVRTAEIAAALREVDSQTQPVNK